MRTFFYLALGMTAVSASTAQTRREEPTAVAATRSIPEPMVVRDTSARETKALRVEARDDVIVRLPGPDPVAVPKPARPAPAEQFTIPSPPALASVSRADLKRSGPPFNPAPLKPAPLHAPPPAGELDAEKDGAVSLQRHLGKWNEEDARHVLGEPNRHRVALNAERKVDGDIYTFADPTGNYREFELDFEKGTGKLRTVFVYPWKMTWTECRRLWGANVSRTTAQNGRVFYSYSNRRLDVLVDGVGKVVSLGLY